MNSVANTNSFCRWKNPWTQCARAYTRITSFLRTDWKSRSATSVGDGGLMKSKTVSLMSQSTQRFNCFLELDSKVINLLKSWYRHSLNELERAKNGLSHSDLRRIEVFLFLLLFRAKTKIGINVKRSSVLCIKRSKVFGKYMARGLFFSGVGSCLLQPGARVYDIGVLP